MDETLESIMATLNRIENQQLEFYVNMMRMVDIINENLIKKGVAK